MVLKYGLVYFLCRCTQRIYAKKMLEDGELFFNYPKNWIAEANKGNDGQGDKFEGVYTNIVNEKTRRLRKDSEVVFISKKSYLRSRDIINEWPCMSFYGATEAHGGKFEEGKYIFDVGKQYIDSFCKGETFESMQKKPLDERITMITIAKTKAFMERVREYFGSQGMKEREDYFMQSVEYRKKGQLFVCERIPMELFSKEYKYKNQQEFRIVLNPNSPKVQSILKDGHYVYIGSLKGIISLRRCPYEGYKLKIDKQARSVEGGDWPNFWGPLHEWDLRSLLGVMKIAGRDMHFRLNGEVVGSYRFWIEIEYVLLTKYNIHVAAKGFEDGDTCNEEVTLYFGSDDLRTITQNEDSDSYYYMHEGVYQASNVTSLMGQSGTVILNYMIKNGHSE